MKKSGVFLCNKQKTAVKPTIHQNSAASKALLIKFLNDWLILNTNSYCIPCRHSLLGKTTKQPLNSFELQKF